MAGEPARGYSWPPFAPGHELSIRHGIWSKRRVEPLVAELIAGVLVDRPDLGRFPEATAAWARAEARCLLLEDYLAAEGIASERGEKTLRFVAQFEREAREHRKTLGLDPHSEADLMRNRADAANSAWSLDKALEKGRQVLDLRSRDDGSEAA